MVEVSEYAVCKLKLVTCPQGLFVQLVPETLRALATLKPLGIQD